MAVPSFLHWPFFEARHRELYADVAAWCDQNLDAAHGGARETVDAHCVDLVRKLGSAGMLR